MKMRSYEGLQDLYAMLDLLTAGRAAKNGTHYVHRGDLQWWLFYTDTPQEVCQSNIRLWMENDRLVGWALITPDEKAFDVFTVPELCGDQRQHEMLAWAVENMQGFDSIETLWTADDDTARIGWLERNGFKPEVKHDVYFTRSLTGHLPESPLPSGYYIRASRGTEEDARLRAVASHAAFGSSKPFDEYWPRTWKFVQSPVYVPEHELFVMSPQGQVAAYCIVWTDELTKVGHFEPVGTHPNFQRKGLGKSLLLEAMRRLKSEGMTEADVCTNHNNEAAIHLYKSVGFQKSKRLLIYSKNNQKTKETK